MLSEPLRRALSTVGAFLAADPELAEAARAFWRDGGRDASAARATLVALPEELRGADLVLAADDTTLGDIMISPVVAAQENDLRDDLEKILAKYHEKGFLDAAARYEVQRDTAAQQAEINELKQRLP